MAKARESRRGSWLRTWSPLTSFAGKPYGMRSKKIKRLAKELKDEIKLQA